MFQAPGEGGVITSLQVVVSISEMNFTSEKYDIELKRT